MCYISHSVVEVRSVHWNTMGKVAVVIDWSRSVWFSWNDKRYQWDLYQNHSLIEGDLWSIYSIFDFGTKASYYHSVADILISLKSKVRLRVQRKLEHLSKVNSFNLFWYAQHRIVTIRALIRFFFRYKCTRLKSFPLLKKINSFNFFLTWTLK